MRDHRANLLAGLSPRALFHAMGARPDVPLTAQESASTLFRFFRSRHVVDLKLIFTVALLIALVSGVVLAVQLLILVFGLVSIEKTLEPVSQIYAVPLFAFCCVIIGWAYRSASTRLGVVDLFACEIATLCRVGTVFDIGTHYVELYDAAEPSRSSEQTFATSRLPHEAGSFVSQEQYFPVFDGNSRDLQLLEARVVNDIVEFYTYMKAMRDSLRMLANIEAGGRATTQPNTPPATSARNESPRQLAILNVIYMTYLAYESGRLAIASLVEFEPSEAENTMVVLITELTCYAFLLRCFHPRDLRHLRLELRREVYEAKLRKLRHEVTLHPETDTDWLPARRTIDELNRRYALLPPLDAECPVVA